MSDARQELATLFKQNPQLAERNPELAAEVLAPARARKIEDKFPEITGELPAAISFVVPGNAVAKPRMTQSDKWNKRPSVVRYRNWADFVRACANKAIGMKFPGAVLHSYYRIRVICYFEMPRSWNEKTKAAKRGAPHDLKPDADNVIKGVADSLYPTGDSQIYDMHITKLWDDGQGPRSQITLY